VESFLSQYSDSRDLLASHVSSITIYFNLHPPFKHLLYHYRLAYSGWQYVQIVQGGESFISLSQGLQNALSASGGSPQQHRSDSLSAAYKNSGGRKRKQLTKFYEELCSHYRLQPTRNNLGIAHENGSIESPHGYFKRRLEQAMRLRNFAVWRGNSGEQERLDINLEDAQ
jgi:hypothetical protein